MITARRSPGSVDVNKVREFLEDHLGVIIAVLIAAVTIILTVVIFTVFVGTNTDRRLYIMEAAGGVSVIRGDGQAAVGRNTEIKSGDVIVTNGEGTVKIKAENGKYIYIEPNSTVYVDYSEKTEHGKIIVNISDGAVVCRLDNKLKNDAVFQVRTPNSIISAQGTVFCVDFSFHSEYLGYEDVMLTKVFSVESMLDLQLFNNVGEKSGKIQPLGEGFAAELVSSPAFNGYTSLNQEYSFTELSSHMLRSLIQISGERNIPASLSDLTAAFNAVYGRAEEETEEIISVPPATVSTSEYIITTAAPHGTLPDNSAEETAVPTEIVTSYETESVINSDTVGTSQTTEETSVSSSRQSVTGGVTVSSSQITSSETTEATVSAAPPSFSEVTRTGANWWEITNTQLSSESETAS